MQIFNPVEVVVALVETVEMELQLTAEQAV
jgi:hypothetical protein